MLYYQGRVQTSALTLPVNAVLCLINSFTRPRRFLSLARVFLFSPEQTVLDQCAKSHGPERQHLEQDNKRPICIGGHKGYNEMVC